MDKPVRFQQFKKDINMKSGSLWSNMRNLEDMGLVTMRKEIDETGKEAYTVYHLTEKGKTAYMDLRSKLITLLQ